tara:strand:- start:77 stop:391 length:315 start_codon:yes stop_codon:yes gene_type:complete
MSIRRANYAHVNTSADEFKLQIENLRSTSTISDRSALTVGDANAMFESLSETEKSAATIGESADELKPIGWMNSAHYTSLLKKNALSGRLTQQIEAYKHVAAQS